ncbi:hypothetical protein LTR10_007399 [Elasticomyces elasticus]|nr:hypothetical protein LTR10_007399 [Elasticomyces elasticus]KAK4979210.1 hypothetical protein LTR42_001713 [Elasticomyces elasticus]
MDDSQTSTASDYIATQLRLEEEAREALPYQFNTCTKPLGPLRQSVFACLTCSPPPASVHQQHTPAGVCYSCSISCHGEHNLVELFTKRDFECDCGSTRYETSGTACTLRQNAVTGSKGDVKGEVARVSNRYNQNYEGKFCGCGEEYDPEREKGTMFQCLGLGTAEQGGCGEDWWHAECLMGLPRQVVTAEPKHGGLETMMEEGGDAAANDDGEETDDLPPGFPAEDDFDHLICYKCVETFPWIKQYAGTAGFLPAVSADGLAAIVANGSAAEDKVVALSDEAATKKRKADDEEEILEAPDNKKVKATTETLPTPAVDLTQGASANSTEPDPSVSLPAAKVPTNGHTDSAGPRHATLPPAPTGRISLFLKEDFRDSFCRCPDCFPRLALHRQLLEEEESYEPPLSESAPSVAAGAPASIHSGGSLLERGEAALSSMDRVKAIEGVMAYNHVKDKVREFLKPFAESGQPVGAEEIREYFAKLRGDETAEREAAAAAVGR